MVDIDQNLLVDPINKESLTIKQTILDHIDYIAKWTGTDIFLLRPKQMDVETTSFMGTLDNSLDQRFRVAIYGDMESSEHSKTRILIMIDQIVRLAVSRVLLGLTLDSLNVRRISSSLTCPCIQSYVDVCEGTSNK